MKKFERSGRLAALTIVIAAIVAMFVPSGAFASTDPSAPPTTKVDSVVSLAAAPDSADDLPVADVGAWVTPGVTLDKLLAPGVEVPAGFPAVFPELVRQILELQQGRLAWVSIQKILYVDTQKFFDVTVRFHAEGGFSQDEYFPVEATPAPGESTQVPTSAPSPSVPGNDATTPPQGGDASPSTPEPSAAVSSGATVAPTEPGSEVTQTPNPSAPSEQPGDPAVQRVAGKDRVATATAVYRAGSFGGDTVVLVSGRNYPDALAAAPLAAQRKAPILVTTSPQLEASILQVLQEKQVARVVIVGGERSVPAAVASRLQGEGFKVERVAGANRFATAVEAAKAVGALRPSQKVFVVDGTNFADALSVGAVANKHGGAILLSNGKQLPPETLNHLKATNLDVVAVGGNAAASLKGYGGPGKVSQVVGLNRYQTAVKVAEQFAPGAKYAAVVSGDQFADALGAAALAADNDGVLLLTSRNTLDKGTADYLRNDSFKSAHVVGGKNAVSESALGNVKGALRK